jgi:hypothetical protein
MELPADRIFAKIKYKSYSHSKLVVNIKIPNFFKSWEFPGVV